MRPSLRTALSTALIVALFGSASFAAVVTVNMVSVSAQSDSSSLDVGKAQVHHDQLGLTIKNLNTTPQTFSLKVGGLTQPSYDVYANGKFVGEKQAAALVSGISLIVDGRVADPLKIRCLDAARGPLRSALNRLASLKDPESQRVCATLGQAVGWVSTSLLYDQNWRSVSIVLAPAGKALYRMGADVRKDAEETAGVADRACWLLQQARSRMSKVIKNPQLRHEAVTVLTPVTFSVEYATKNGKPHVEAVLVNNCDLAAIGSVSAALPKGWKCSSKGLTAIAVKPGKTLKLSFDLVAPSKTATPPDSLPIAANLSITQNGLTAALKLKQVAAKQ